MAQAESSVLARGSGAREELLEIHSWNWEEYDEEDDDDQEEDDDEWDGGYWVHEEERMSDIVDEEEYEDEDGGDEDDHYPDGFRGHGGHGQDLDDSLIGRRLGTPPTNDREGTAVLIKDSQQGSHASREADTGYLLQICLPPHPMVESGPGAVTRIIRVPTRMTFAQLAESINTTFDWAGYHAYLFKLCKPCRRSVRCMCERCEPIVAKFNQLVNRVACVDEWAEQFYSNFDADKVALSDVWGHEACRGMSVWYRYDFGANWQHLLHFLGEADRRLGPAMALPRSQEIWCLSGEGHPWPGDMREDWIHGKDHTNLYAWDREVVNKKLGKQSV
jgi:hypothetical protein